jgi:lipopolysaccharide biosynthesis glycosyltransferase
MINIFIGYDTRESIAYHVCVQSIIGTSSQPVAITPLVLDHLKDYQESHQDGSNQFIYSRFLVPHLMNHKGWALFVDGDMVFREDISNLWDLRDDKYAVMCVHHDYISKATHKYLGAKNTNYPRKNWSSVVLWNCSHPSNQHITPEFVRLANGPTLHRFKWLKDSEIGQLPIEWNWLPDEFGTNHQARLLHWTLGTPCFNEYADAPMANEWHQEFQRTTYSAQVCYSRTESPAV